MYGCDADNMFAIWSMMKNSPYKLLLYTFIVSVAIFAYTIRIFEHPISDVSGSNLHSFANSTWLVIVTMTTVGYGDFYPKTDAGRFIGIIIALWGVFFVSLAVATLNEVLLFNSGEEKSYNLLEKLLVKEELRIKASGVLASAYKQRVINK
jgi:potassium intermediate/small conductance calcium-activated channel subfamily N protein 2